MWDTPHSALPRRVIGSSTKAKSGKRVSPPFKPILLRISCDGLLEDPAGNPSSLAVDLRKRLDDRKRAAAIPYNFRTAAEAPRISKAKLLILLALPRGLEPLFSP